MSDLNGAHYHITGIVQGVGFRPFVYSLATELKLNGWVKNTSAGVEIEVEGPTQVINAFTTRLQSEAPPLAHIDELLLDNCLVSGHKTFTIVKSEAIPQAFQPISPDVSVCDDCLQELFNPLDRRYLYPFTNCTNCGPRFTIIEDTPYDRPNTTMASFDLCPECLVEYNDPLDRRFHAQPVACPKCGPHVWLELNPHFLDGNKGSKRNGVKTQIKKTDAIIATQGLLQDGHIVAIKGLGGFHIACDATNPDAVKELRNRKMRVEKPFAVMMPNIETIRKHCILGEPEIELLRSRERPILILERKPGSKIADEIAPNQNTVGVMLPYTPLHYLLFVDWNGCRDNKIEDLLPDVYVMTSGNISEEPIALDNKDARKRLSILVDAYLVHDRPIHIRCDDSVVRKFNPRIDEKNKGDRASNITILRRSRGYAPNPIRIPWEGLPLLATGAELKNTFCLTRAKYAFLSHHIGDLENYETLLSFEEGIHHFESLYKIHPEAIAYDLHPNYLPTRYALKRAEHEGIPSIGVQHHHAHIAACMAEHGLPADQRVIGVSFDGTGYGEDGAIWGGEFLFCDYTQYARFAHLAYTPLPGGDASTRTPARTALAYLWKSGIDWEDDLPPTGFISSNELTILRAQLDKNINSPMTSSMGRLFDAVAALLDVRQQINYEAQAAIELEALVDPEENMAYPFDILHSQEIPDDKNASHFHQNTIKIDYKPVLEGIISELRNGIEPRKISARFHNGIAIIVKDICLAMRNETSINHVVLSGGVWQNMILLQKTIELLEAADFDVMLHSAIPPNDGGIALGQAAIATHRLKK